MTGIVCSDFESLCIMSYTYSKSMNIFGDEFSFLSNINLGFYVKSGTFSFFFSFCIVSTLRIKIYFLQIKGKWLLSGIILLTERIRKYGSFPMP